MEDSRPNSPFVPLEDYQTDNPRSKKELEPAPQRPMSIKPSSTSMDKPEVDNSEKSEIMNIMKQQQEMLVMMREDIDRLHEGNSKSWCNLL